MYVTVVTIGIDLEAGADEILAVFSNEDEAMMWAEAHNGGHPVEWEGSDGEYSFCGITYRYAVQTLELSTYRLAKVPY